MNERMYRACADVLLFAVELPRATNLPEPNVLRQSLQTALDTLVGKGRSLGVPDADLAEARYALVAFIDEQIQKSSWAGREQWATHPLQLVLYREIMSGKKFFERLRALVAANRVLALEIYYLCLALGFRGALADPRGPGSFAEVARQKLAKALPAVDPISPHAKARERARPSSVSRKRLWQLLAACAAVVLFVLVGFGWATRAALGDARRVLEPAHASRVPTGP